MPHAPLSHSSHVSRCENVRVTRCTPADPDRCAGLEYPAPRRACCARQDGRPANILSGWTAGRLFRPVAPRGRRRRRGGPRRQQRSMGRRPCRPPTALSGPPPNQVHGIAETVAGVLRDAWPANELVWTFSPHTLTKIKTIEVQRPHGRTSIPPCSNCTRSDRGPWSQPTEAVPHGTANPARLLTPENAT